MLAIDIEGLPEIAGNLLATAQDAGELLAKTSWRIEVTHGGRYWQFRTGSGKNRRSAYGGKFSQLSEERQKQYEENRKSYAR